YFYPRTVGNSHPHCFAIRFDTQFGGALCSSVGVNSGIRRIRENTFHIQEGRLIPNDLTRMIRRNFGTFLTQRDNSSPQNAYLAKDFDYMFDRVVCSWIVAVFSIGSFHPSDWQCGDDDPLASLCQSGATHVRRSYSVLILPKSSAYLHQNCIVSVFGINYATVSDKKGLVIGSKNAEVLKIPQLSGKPRDIGGKDRAHHMRVDLFEHILPARATCGR